jgi:hypothetical protein
MKKSSLGFGLGITMLLAVALNFVSQDATANMAPGKITCHSSSSPGSGHTYTACSTCTSAAGIGSDAGQCRPS